MFVCVCVFLRENFKSYHEYILREGIRFRENAKISAVRSLADICFLHVLIWLITCIYYLVCLCFGIFGVKYFAYNYISVLFIPIRSSGL